MADLEQIAQQQERYLSLLPEVRACYGKIPGVDLVGLGAKERGGRVTDEWAWRFYVRAKRPLHEILLNEQIPPEIFGVQTDVIVHLEHNDLVCDAGSLPANTLINDETEYRDLGGIFGGAPIRNEYFKSDKNSGYGTLGMLVRRVSDKHLMGLTCAHVVNAAADSMTATGTHVGQPRYWVSCCCCPKGSIGTVSAASHYSNAATPNLDCALVEIDDDIRKKAKANVIDDVLGDFPFADTLENKILGHSVLEGADDAAKKTFIQANAITVTGARSVMCFDNVKKRGRGTGLTTGKVVEVAYGTDQMMIKRTGTDADTSPFACHGDSGAMIISTSDNKVLGMVVAGMMETYEEGGVQKKRLTRTIATHIKPIMQALNIKIAGTVIGTVGEPESGGPNGCEIKAWPGGQTTTALNPGELFEIDSFFDTGAGGGDWNVTEGAGGALIVEKDDVPLGVPVASVTNASKIRVRYDTASVSSAVNHAVKVKVVRGGIPASKFRTVFSITPTLNTSAAKDAQNSKQFLDNGNAGLVTPDAAHTRYLAKAEIVYQILPADIEWGTATAGNMSFVTGSPTGTLGNILARRETKFCRGEQGTAAVNRTHTDQATWISAGDSSASDFQEPSGAVKNKMFRLANKGFNPVIESADINHDTYNPTAYLQRYVRSNYRDFLQFYNGPVIGWVTITPQTAWSVNFTGGLSVVVPHVAPPVVSVVVGENVIEAGENTLALPNSTPVLSPGNIQEVAIGGGTVTLTAVVNDPDLDVTTVHWTRISGTVVALSGGGVGNPVTFTAPAADAQIIFNAIARDNTQGLSRAPNPPNFESAPPGEFTVNVVQTQVRNGGEARLCLNNEETFNAADFHIGAGPLHWNVISGATNATVIESGGTSVAPTGEILGVGTNSIRVNYNNVSASAARAHTVVIRATNPGTGRIFFKRRTVNAIPAHAVVTAVAPGAAPSIPVGANWGLTFPENVTVTICAFRAGANWQATLLTANGNYSLQAQLLPGVLEVTGPPPGNTNLANYCNQLNDLHSLNSAGGAGTWFMISAVVAHENVHATRFLPALNHVSVLPVLQATIDALTVPHVAGMNQAGAIAALMALPAFATALTTAHANWLARILVLVAGDHAPGGPTQVAERAVVTPMITAICAHRTANGWAACPPACP